MGTRTSGSEVRAGETGSRKRGHRAPARPYYESLRRYGAKEGVLAAWGTTTDGTKQLLHLAVGNKESEQCWTEFLRDMVARGLRAPPRSPPTGHPG